MDKVLIIFGPTATGKTDLAIKFAKKFNGELVSCDSRQVYKGLDIGTGKITNSKLQIVKSDGCWLVDGVKIWMFDVADPKIQYTVFDFTKDANVKISDILKREKLPIVVGGTGFYLKALLEGFSSLNIPINKFFREELSLLTLQELQVKLRKLSLAKYNSLNNSDKNNPRRLLRSIEIISMYPYGGRNQKSEVRSQNWDIFKIGLTAPIEVLRKKINLSFQLRLKQGMIEEAKNLYDSGLSLDRMRELGLEYKFLADFIEGKLTKDQLTEKLQFKIGQYAKRQLTWFKKEKNVNWFDITQQSLLKKVENKIKIWYNQLVHDA